MSRKAAVCLVLLLGSVFVAVGASRAVSDLRLSTLTGMPLTFEVAVTDDEIDPLAPETHALFFSIERGPQHGVVAGDFAAVLYSAPSTAMLILTYTTAPSFSARTAWSFRRKILWERESTWRSRSTCANASRPAR